MRASNTARHTDADHEGKCFLQLVLAAAGADVAVILLVSAVEFQQLLVVLAHRASRKVREPGYDRAPEIVAVDLDVFVRGEFLVTHDDINFEI